MAGRFKRRGSALFDTVGVQDLVLLDQHLSQDAVRDNLRARFVSKHIYTYIGSVLLAVNPYEELNIYNEDYIREYEGANMFELPPHIFAIADQAYRCMRDESIDQCILISGESGAGKTESSKKILHFLAHCSGNAAQANTIRNRLLRANPILEAFGNATTVLNDNSSRFGKYMEIQFDFKGEPMGGRILNYLLEKSRVVLQMPGERNFHIFYMLLSGADRLLLQRLHLQASAGMYWYTRQGGNLGSSSEDAALFSDVYDALGHLGFRPEEIKALFEIVASVVHLGEVNFEAAGEHCTVKSREPLGFIAELLSIDAAALADCLTYQTITARGQSYRAQLSRDKALYARDALAKAMYMRTFTWLVGRLNQLLAGPDAGRVQVLGLLDIYGFEIMRTNSFEQFCINYCNEKLQQLFIELTLKQEQEEYAREGIAWEPVQFFDNKIICDMVEENHKGIVALLDEECLRPGDVSDETFLGRMDIIFARHKHYKSFGAAVNKDRRSHARGTFQISHYAGDVVYTVEGFLDKNNDLLFRDMKEVIHTSKNPVACALFPSEELQSLRRPPTAATQFKNSMNALIEILMKKTPWYVRCIKPNAGKKPAVFEDDLVRHQIKYLNLMENLRVRRAGFAYRRAHELFLQRYKCLSPHTWPHPRTAPPEAVRLLLTHMRISPNEFRIGHTKVFIRTPATLFAIEERFQKQKHKVVAKIQAHVRGRQQRAEFLRMKAAVVMIAKHWRRIAAQRRLKQLKQAYLDLKLACLRWIRRRQRAYRVIENLVRGFKLRHQPRCADNATFLNLARYHWLVSLKAFLPAGIMDHTWCPKPPPALQQPSALLQRMHKRLQVRKYIRALTPERKAQLTLKLAASEMFKDKKQSYPASIAAPFVEARLEPPIESHRNYNNFKRMLNKLKDTAGLKYVSPVVKYDRSKGTPRHRVLVLTPTAAYFLQPENLSLVSRLDLLHLKGCSVSPLSDTVLVLHTDLAEKKDKGDFILSVPHLIEFATILRAATQNRIAAVVSASPACTRRSGRPVPLAFAVGPEAAERKKGIQQFAAPAAAVPDHYTRHLQAVAARARALQQPPVSKAKPPRAAAAGPASKGPRPAPPPVSPDASSALYESIASTSRQPSVASPVYAGVGSESIYDTTDTGAHSTPTRMPQAPRAGPGPAGKAQPNPFVRAGPQVVYGDESSSDGPVRATSELVYGNERAAGPAVKASAQLTYGDEAGVKQHAPKPSEPIYGDQRPRLDSLGNGVYGDDGSSDYVPPHQRPAPARAASQVSLGVTAASALKASGGSKIMFTTPPPSRTPSGPLVLQEPVYGDPDADHVYGEVGTGAAAAAAAADAALYGEIEETYGF